MIFFLNFILSVFHSKIPFSTLEWRWSFVFFLIISGILIFFINIYFDIFMEVWFIWIAFVEILWFNYYELVLISFHINAALEWSFVLKFWQMRIIERKADIFLHGEIYWSTMISILIVLIWCAYDFKHYIANHIRDSWRKNVNAFD